MYEGTTLENLVTKIQHTKTFSTDFLADTRQLSIDVTSSNRSTLHIQDTGEFDLTGHGMSQLRTHLKIPSSFAGMLVEKDMRSLLQRNINDLLPANPGLRMIRTINGTARAYLSNSYKIIDNYDVAQTTLETLSGMHDEGHRFDIVSCEVTERKMYIKVIFPMSEREVKRGDAVQFGCIISNSEIGEGRCSVEWFVLRLACTNGMVLADKGMKRSHLGRKLATDPGQLVSQIYQTDTLEADVKLLMLTLRDTIRAAVNEAEIDAHVNKLRNAAHSREVVRPVAAIKMLTSETMITNDEGETVLEQLLRNGDMTRWGMVNAITEASKVAPDYDRATALEALGGTVLDFSENRWRKIADTETV